MIVSYVSDNPFIEAMVGEEGLLEDAMLERRRDVLMQMILRIVLVNPPA
jgi:hypothetical protein